MTASEAIVASARALWSGVIDLGPASLATNAALSLGVILLGILAARLSRLGLRRCVLACSRSRDGERRRQLRRISRRSQAAINLALILGGAVAIAAIWGGSDWLFIGSGRRLLGAVGRFLLTFALTVAAIEAASLAIHQLMAGLIRGAEEPRRAAQLATLAPLLRGAANAAILVIGGITLLSQAGVRIGPLLAGAGVVGIAVGFGAQTLVKDMLTGIFLIAEDIVSVGDVVQVGTSSGVVERMTLRTIHLRGLDGTLHILPYSEAQVVHNMTKTFSFYVFDLQVSYDADIDLAIDIIRRTGEELMQDSNFADKILAPIEILGVDSLGDSGVVLKARFMTKPIEQWGVGREYNRRIKMAFDREGVEIPYPHIRLVLPDAQDVKDAAKGP